MCMQCVTRSVLYGEIFPDWYLVRATQGDLMGPNKTSVWNKGEFGLVQVNDPDYIFGTIPMKDPFYDWTDEQINSASPEFCALSDCFMDSAIELEESLQSNPETGWRLINAAIQVGYNPKEDGRFSFWFLHYLACFIESIGEDCINLQLEAYAKEDKIFASVGN